MLANLRVQMRLRDETKGSTYHQLKFHLSSSLGTSFRLKLTAVEGRSSPFHKRLRCFFMWPHIALNLSYETPQRAHSYCTRGKFKSGMWALALAMAPPATLCLLEFLVFRKVDALWPALIGPGLCCVWLGGNWKSVGFPMVVFLCSNMVTWKRVKGNARGFWRGGAVFISKWTHTILLPKRDNRNTWANIRHPLHFPLKLRGSSSR